HRCVAAGQTLETLLAAGIRKGSAIEDKTAAITAFILGKFLTVRKTKHAQRQVLRFGYDALQLLRRKHVLEGVHQGGKLDRHSHVFKEPLHVLQSEWDALQEMRFAFVQAAKAVSAHRLHDADINVRIKMAHEDFAVESNDHSQSI